MNIALAKSRFGWKRYLLALITLILFAFLPLMITFSAMGIAEMNGCALHEGYANPCVIAGTDWGETLYAMGVVAWLSMITFPLSMTGLLLWLVVLVVHLGIRKIRNSSNRIDAK